MRLRVYGCALKCVEVLASFFTCACSRRIFVSVCEFGVLPKKREFIIFRVSTHPSTKKEVGRTTERTVVFFLSSAFTKTSFALPRVHPRGFQLLSRARGPHSKRARGGDGKGVTWQPLVQSWFSV